MTGPSLKEALRLVETLGTAPLARVAAAQPKDQRRFAQWLERHDQVERDAAEKLAAHGAYIHHNDGAFTGFAFAGVNAASTMGIGQAMRNWKNKAEKRLKGNGR